jgi:hypothetical protein
MMLQTHNTVLTTGTLYLQAVYVLLCQVIMEVYGLFKKAVSSSEHIVLNGRMINELEGMWKEMKMA